MAEYKKRQIKKVKLNKKNTIKYQAEQAPKRIKMTRSGKQISKNDIVRKQTKRQPYRLIKGRRIKKRALIFGAAAIALIFLLICQLSLPTGILEFLQNSYSLQSVSGSGTESLMGATFLQSNARYGRIDLLSGAYYEVYNTNGGTVYTDQHGFSSPVMVSSTARTLIYDRNNTDCCVYNFSKPVYNISVEGKIYTGTISRNSKVALAYKSNDYISVIEVFNKRGKSLFVKNFSHEYVTSLAFTLGGRYLTATTLYSKDGIFHSNLYVFDTSKKKQLSKNEYDDIYFTASESLGNSTTLAISYDKAIVVFPRKDTVKVLDISEKISNYSVSKNGTIGTVCNRENNNIDNKIRIFNKKGELINKLNFTGAVDGFSISNKHIYILSGGILYSYTIKDLKKEETPFENAQLLAAFNGGAVAVSGAKLILE